MPTNTPKDDWFTVLIDYLANSYGTALAAGFLVGGGIAYSVISLFPNILNKNIDPGIILLLTFFIPFAVTAIAVMIWARRWKERRAEERTLQPK